MTRLTRKNLKVFAGNATNNGVFGSLQANNPTTTTDIEAIQSLPAWESGWNSATESSELLPPLEEAQGINYVNTYETAYILQEGIAEWDPNTTYYKSGLAKEITSTGFKLYSSLADDNTGNELSDTTKWKKIMDSDAQYAFNDEVVHLTGDETIGGVKTFTSETMGIASDSIGSFVTTAGKQKNTDGFFKLGNGLIIQWGRTTDTSSQTKSIVFPTEFSSTNYIFVSNPNDTSSGYSYDGITGISNRQTTGCEVYSYYAGRTYDWLAIGY